MYQSLQACRAAAAIMVVLFHLGGTFAQRKYFGYDGFDHLFGWGDSGVEFFFVLSGFLITSAHWKDLGQPAKLPHYAMKRALRIFPTYWIVCALVCGAAMLVPSLRQALPSDPVVFLKALALLPQDPDVVVGTGSPILFVAWSLHYELFFYAVMAAFILNRTLGLLIVAALMVVRLDCQFGAACSFPLTFFANNLLVLFGFGVAAALLMRSGRRLRHPLGVAVLAGIAFIGFGVFEQVVGRDTIGWLDRRLVYGTAAAVLICGLVQAERSGALVLRQRWVGLLGDSSYALYLLHIPIISVLCKVYAKWGAANPVVLAFLFASVVLACIGISALFYVLIERRILSTFGLGARDPARPGQAPRAARGSSKPSDAPHSVIGNAPNSGLN